MAGTIFAGGCVSSFHLTLLARHSVRRPPRSAVSRLLAQLVYDNGVRQLTPLGHSEYAGFEYGTYSSGWNVWVPWWLPTLLFLIAPTLWAYRTWRGAKQGTAGTCPACGYDLRATPELCPECGHVTGVTAPPGTSPG